MQTHTACLPCLRKQAEYTLRLACPEPTRRSAIRAAVEEYLAGIDPALSPPENATGMYQLIAREARCPDPYAALKKKSNDLALALRARVRKEIRASADPLLAAIRFAVAGNIIDYGAHHDFDIKQTMDRCLHHDFAINDYTCFREELGKAEKIVFLADNCGEIVFDDLLIGEIGGNMLLAVKDSPIINDATLADVAACNIGQQYRVIGNGTACPGTPLDRCSREFLSRFQDADLIISKGQGNFETLSARAAPLYFLLTVKCGVVAGHLQELNGIRVKIGDMILCKQKKGSL
ncbi:damage-control phosphatase ARMT1 family protein [Thiovibrio sp. JS02]